MEPIIENIKSEGIQIDYDKLPKITTSKILFSIVLRNLIGNSIKYRSKERPLTIKIDIQDEPDSWLVSVSDNGNGTKKQNHENIFRPFFKEDKTNNSGVGMGLASCKKIVQTLGGEIKVDSEFNKGSTFSFHIPK